MTDPCVPNSADADAPAEYRIRVRGILGERCRDRLGGLAMIHEDHVGPPHTLLTGRLADQAALMGVLEYLYARGATLVMIERVEESNTLHQGN